MSEIIWCLSFSDWLISHNIMLSRSYTNKENKDRLIDIEQHDTYVVREGGVVWCGGKRTQGHGQQCGDCGWGGAIREIDGNGKNTIKIIK